MRLGVSYNGCKVCHCQQRTETISARFQVSSPTHPTPSHAGRHPLIAWQAHSHSESASERSTSTETTRRRGLSAAQRQSCGQRWCILPVVVVQISVPLEGSPVAGVQSWMTIKKTEISAQHEFLKPIYLCVHRVIVLIYLDVHQKC